MKINLEDILKKTEKAYDDGYSSGYSTSQKERTAAMILLIRHLYLNDQDLINFLGANGEELREIFNRL